MSIWTTPQGKKALDNLNAGVLLIKRAFHRHYRDLMLDMNEHDYAEWKRQNRLDDLSHENTMWLIRSKLRCNSPLLLVNQSDKLKACHQGAELREWMALRHTKRMSEKFAFRSAAE